MADCQNALKESDDDVEKAIEHLRKRVWRPHRTKPDAKRTKGRSQHISIRGNRMSILVEINCETDFVARNDEFQAFVKDVALQIAASKPSYVKREDIHC